MSLFQIILTVVFAICACLLVWYLYHASQYMRNHPDEFPFHDMDSFAGDITKSNVNNKTKYKDEQNH